MRESSYLPINPLFLSILFLFSFILRFSLITNGPYHTDCLNLALSAEQTFNTKQLYYLYGFGYPLVVILGAFFIGILKWMGVNDPIFAVNLMSVVFSSLCIVVFYIFVQKLLNPLSATIAALILTVLPSFLGVSVYGSGHPIFLFFLLLGLTTLISSSKSNRTIYFAVFFFGLAGAARVQDLILMVIPISYLFLTRPNPEKSRSTGNSLIIFWSLVFIFIALCHSHLLIHAKSAYTEQFSTFWLTGVESNFRGIFSKSLLRSAGILTFNLYPVGLLLSAAGLYTLKKTNPKLCVFLLLWFLIPLGFYGNLYSTVSRFLILSLLPLIIGLAYFLNIYLNKSWIKKILLVSFAGFLFLLLNTMYPLLTLRHTYALLPNFARCIAENTEENSYIIAGDEAPFISYFGHRRILPRPENAFKLDPLELDNFKNEIEDLLNNKIPVYITANGLLVYNPHNQFLNLIENNFELTYIGRGIWEAWHPGEIQLGIIKDKLFRVTLKQK